MNTGSPDWSLSTALKAFKAVSPEGGHISSTPAGPNMKLSILGMQRISGWPDIRLDNPAFFISGIRPDTGHGN